MRLNPVMIIILSGMLLFSGCTLITTPYHITKETIKTAYKITKTTYRITKFTVKTAIGAVKVIYKIGKFTFVVIKAPLKWPLTHPEIQSIDNMPPKEAIRRGRVKDSPYVVRGRRYVPMNIQQAKHYRQIGYASWYGYETLRQPGGHMTANGEVFDPRQLTAAHKYLPLPTYVRVTNLENGRSIIVRVNDRGPFVKGRIIDLTMEGAKRLGYLKKGVTRVLVETIEVAGT